MHELLQNYKPSFDYGPIIERTISPVIMKPNTFKCECTLSILKNQNPKYVISQIVKIYNNEGGTTYEYKSADPFDFVFKAPYEFNSDKINKTEIDIFKEGLNNGFIQIKNMVIASKHPLSLDFFQKHIIDIAIAQTHIQKYFLRGN
ncbi:MAG: DUF3045 domain-containing protein [Bacteroidia bacterium]|nr:DUF3045 domain-containing protein [Bacteroidia bacterium]MBP7259697.1 DUF3045 domain-containing protein [Bacteroidia bacterium]MBP9179394.1 DUF3045 domain-containing protein [Bacteroidia bacterium]MBP9723352.1 DUF3045 domain-containing protein [Bacteroidia bacterium]